MPSCRPSTSKRKLQLFLQFLKARLAVQAGEGGIIGEGQNIHFTVLNSGLQLIESFLLFSNQRACPGHLIVGLAPVLQENFLNFQNALEHAMGVAGREALPGRRQDRERLRIPR